jgi:argininosuccinate lyase
MLGSILAVGIGRSRNEQAKTNNRLGLSEAFCKYEMAIVMLMMMTMMTMMING